jgi:chromosome segregation ATPase
MKILVKKITETLATLDEKESALQNLKEKESVFNGHIEELKKKTAPIRQRERELEQAISATENQNQGQMSKEKIEERWRLENERKEVEEARWSIDEEQISLSKERDLLLTQKESLEKEIKELREKVEALRGKEERMLLLIERQKIDSRLEEITKSEEPLELEWINLNEKKVEITKEILPLKGILDGTMRDYKTVSSEEKNASDPTKEHEVESKRWQIEERRRGAERELLAFNEKLEEVERTISTLTATYQGFLKEEEKLKNRIQEINVRSSRLPT